MSGCIVAIDLGTSRSAWAYSFQGQAEETVVIRVPEGCMPPATGNQKTETAVLLSADGHKVLAFGRAARERFVDDSQEFEDALGEKGADMAARPVHIRSNMHEDGSGGHLEAHTTSPATSMLFRWFKMELCRKAGFEKVTDPVATAEGGHTLPLLTVMSAVLRHFKEDAIAHLSSSGKVVGDLSLEEVLGDFIQSITWVVTIPAIYDDFARRFMRVAAHEAGLIDTVDSRRLRLCLEPEAACLAVSVKEAPELSQPGTQTMILDCGGGTVDITTHEVISLSPIRLKELLLPTGGPWGSTYVDSEFTKWFRMFIGDEEYIKIRRTSKFYKILTQWEEQKTRFGGKENEGMSLNMVGFAEEPLGYDRAKMQELRVAHNERISEVPDLHVTGKHFKVTLPSALVRSFFAPTIDKISECLYGLKHDPSLTGLKYVFLVGGFSASPLVQAAARASLDGHRCRVIVVLKPDVAIVKGAVLFANSAEVFTSRKARLTYGVDVLGVYDSSDLEHVSRRLENPVFGDEQKEMISVFSSHLKAGDDVPIGHACRKKRYTPIQQTQDAMTMEILASHKKDIRFPDKGACFPVGKVTVPLDMTLSYDDRGVDVQFVFGGTEVSVNCFRAATGEGVGNAKLEFMQEAVKTG